MEIFVKDFTRNFYNVHLIYSQYLFYEKEANEEGMPYLPHVIQLEQKVRAQRFHTGLNFFLLRFNFSPHCFLIKNNTN